MDAAAIGGDAAMRRCSGNAATAVRRGTTGDGEAVRQRV
jgi:hypothetical protein